MLSAEKANRGYFHTAYRSGQHGWETDKPSFFAVEFLERLRHLLPGGRLLDVGCGEGRHSIAAARRGFRVVGIDYELLALDRARKFATTIPQAKITFRQANIFSLPFRDAYFDIVLDYGCLHHQRKSDWPGYKASILRVMKRSGFFILSVFSPRFRLFGGSKRPWHIASGAYRRYFTREDILSLFVPDFEVCKLIEQRGNGGGFWHALMERRPRSAWS
jgi:SAM-dependent methyltransferase